MKNYLYAIFNRSNLIREMGLDSKKAKSFTSGAFSMIELIVVVTIILIMMTILLPSLNIAKEYAYRIYCMNNMRQIGTGYRYYFNDYNGRYPDVQRWLDDLSPVYPYIKTLDVFVCPKSDTRELASAADLVGNTDYLVSGNITDIEKNMNPNAGHGNNVYKFDISNPSPTIQAIIDSKINDRLLYEKNYRGHFNGFNVIFLDDLHYETDIGISKYWMLNSKGEIERKLDPFPDL